MGLVECSLEPNVVGSAHKGVFLRLKCLPRCTLGKPFLSHTTGCTQFLFPSAMHTRFEHCIGAVPALRPDCPNVVYGVDIQVSYGGANIFFICW